MRHTTDKTRGEAVLVGASLSGLMTALSLSRAGMTVTLLERSGEKSRAGAALPVGEGLIQRLTGRHASADALPSGPQAWADVHARLRAVVDADPAIRVRAPVRVTGVEQDDRSAWAVMEGGERVGGDLVVGADGHASVVRRHVAPDQPHAVFAGYLIWLGIVDECELQAPPWPESLAILDARGYCLNAYYLPGTDGSLATGRRRLGFGWYDAGRDDLLRASGAVLGDVVQRTVRPGDIPDSVFDDLAAEARAIWPSPWRDAILHCLYRRAVIGTPIGEYMPSRLARGRVCLVGDAAHVPSPMTGRGFDASALDAMALRDALQDEARRDGIVRALRRYETRRLRAARELVRAGYDFSESFASH
ncbi:FAD-dependent monooxygenase [Burkholderia sp. Ac-20379]|uniref:FAD-dependent monooxygenase n=1 Tax=Burkholderia sp. Ac-20379 TaxID=2703900 RepID=UPI0019820BA5|nr:FAD-dependent monooxygenase [Burkholderia sp. Ac-20379]MBN3723683.1 monooxygenase [Burkholderia sp. Ac-20379]